MMPPAAIISIEGGPTFATGGPYAPEAVEDAFCELGLHW